LLLLPSSFFLLPSSFFLSVTARPFEAVEMNELKKICEFCGTNLARFATQCLTRFRWNDSLLAPVASAKAERFTDYIRDSEHVK